MKVERAEVDVQLNQGGLFDGSEGQQGWNWGHRLPLRTTGASLTDDNAYDAVGFLKKSWRVITMALSQWQSKLLI